MVLPPFPPLCGFEFKNLYIGFLKPDVEFIIYEHKILSSVFQKLLSRFSILCYTDWQEQKGGSAMVSDIRQFHLPVYREIPNVGLYLEQTTKFINECFEPLGCIEVTASMISNYVKKGYISRPVKKQYSAEQIAELIFIAAAKPVLSLENVDKLLRLQRDHYPTPEAYNYFGRALEDMLRKTFGLDVTIEELPPDADPEKRILRSVLVAVTQIVYLDHCFDRITAQSQSAPKALPVQVQAAAQA
jgi:hypothetical protein